MDKTVPVIVCGGGSVGLSLAAELGWRGISCLSIEQSSHLNKHPRANAVANRTMEYYRRWGIDKKIMAAGVPPDHPADYYWISHFQGYQLHQMSLPPAVAMQNNKQNLEKIKEEHTWSPYLKTITGQNEVESIILEYVNSAKSVDFRFSKKLIDFTQDETGVSCVIEDQNNHAIENVRCQYLVACDGGRSEVREKLGFKLKGRANLARFVSFYFKANDFMNCHRFGPANIYFPLHKDHAGFILNWDTGKTFTYHRILKDGEEWDSVNPKKAINDVLGCETNIEILSTQPWNAHALVSERYHKGRVFLAGDAAHLFTPTGGFGMNTGVSDAVELAWKIEGMLKGWGGKSLLSTYFDERQPVGVRNTMEAAHCFDQLKKVMIHGDEIDDEGEIGQRLRTKITEDVKKQNKLIASSGTLLGYRYNSSPIIINDESVEPPDDPRKYVPTARPGHRAPHIWLNDDISILDKMGPHFTLIYFKKAAKGLARLEDSAKKIGFPLKVVYIADSDAVKLYDCHYALIRPDLMVAWRGFSIPKNCLHFLDIIRGAK